MAWPVSNPFPIDALGQTLRAAVWQHQANTRLSQDMIGTFALGCAAAAVQDLVDVQRPNLPPSPVSLFTVAIASTGEGKDTAIEPFARPFIMLQKEADEMAQMLRPEHRAETLEWELRNKLLAGELACAIQAGEPTVAIKKRIVGHASQVPAAPVAPQILYKDPTPMTVKLGLCGWRSALLQSMEADEFFNGHMASDFPFINAGWSGTPIVVNRVRGGRRSAPSPRLSMALGVQNEPFLRFLKRRGVEAHDSGFTARFLVACPPSTAGYRMISGFAQSTDLVDAYIARAVALLEESVSATIAGKPRRVLRFTPAAASAFVDVYNDIQVLMRWGNEFFDLRGFASKASENVARVAVVLHVIDGLEGDISNDTFWRAVCIVRWFADQFKLVYSQMPMRPTVEHDASLILQVLCQTTLRGQGDTRRAHLKYSLPDMGQARLNSALGLLIAQNRARIGTTRGAEYISLTSWMPSLPNIFNG